MTSEKARDWVLLLVIGASAALLTVVYFWIEVFPEWKDAFLAWLDKRALIRSAKSFGIEYIPGENIDELRRRVIAKRDEVIK